MPRTRPKLLLRHDLSTVDNGLARFPDSGGAWPRRVPRAERGAPRDLVGRSYRCQVRVRLIPKPGVPHMMVLETIGRGPRGVGEVGAQRVIDLACDVALEATHDFEFGLPLGGAAFGVGASALAVAHAADGDEVQSAVGLAVAAVVEAMARSLPEEAGMGLAPHSAANELSPWSRSMFCPAVTSSWPA